MIPAGQIADMLIYNTKATDQDAIDHVWRTMRLRYYDLIKHYWWQQCWEQTTLTASSDGVVLPADVAGDLAFWDSDGNEYLQRDAQTVSVHSEEIGVYRTFMTEVVRSPLVHALSGLTIQNGSATFSGITDSGSYIGEYIRIGYELSLYKISAANTLSSIYTGPSIVSGKGAYQIRPQGTRVVKFSDDGGAVKNSGTINYAYWSYPPPLFHPTDIIMLPTSRALELATLISLLGGTERREEDASRYRAEFRFELEQMKSMTPDYVIPNSLPENYRGTKMSMGAKRDGYSDDLDTLLSPITDD